MNRLQILVATLFVLAKPTWGQIDCDFTDGNRCGWVIESHDMLHIKAMEEEEPPEELRTINAFGK